MVFISPSFKDTLAGHRNLGYQLFSFMIFHSLLTHRFSPEKCTVNLIEVHLNMTWHFSLSDLKTLSFSYIFDSLIIMYYGEDLFWSSLFMVHKPLYKDIQIFPKIMEFFCYYFIGFIFLCA
jgi:hypothetical protein